MKYVLKGNPARVEKAGGVMSLVSFISPEVSGVIAARIAERNAVENFRRVDNGDLGAITLDGRPDIGIDAYGDLIDINNGYYYINEMGELCQEAHT